MIDKSRNIPAYTSERADVAPIKKGAKAAPGELKKQIQRPIRGRPEVFDKKPPPTQKPSSLLAGERANAANRAVKGMLQKTDRMQMRPVVRPPQSPLKVPASTAPVTGRSSYAAQIKASVGWDPTSASSRLPQSVVNLRQSIARGYNTQSLLASTGEPKQLPPIFSKGVSLNQNVRLQLVPSLTQNAAPTLRSLQSLPSIASNARFVQLSALPGLREGVLSKQVMTDVKLLDQWLNQEVRQVLHSLRERFDGPKQLENLPLNNASKIFAQTGWIGVALYIVLQEGKPEDRETEVDVEQLEELVLAEIQAYFDSQDFTKVPAPKMIFILESNVKVVFVKPRVLTGLPLSFEDREIKGATAADPVVMLSCKSPDHPVAGALKKVESSINYQVDQAAEELERRNPGKSPEAVFEDFFHYTWKDCAAYILLRGRSPKQLQT